MSLTFWERFALSSASLTCRNRIFKFQQISREIRVIAFPLVKFIVSFAISAD